MKVRVARIDTDWYEDDRPKIYDYIINRFGQQKTAYILALGTLAEKNTIATICKGLCIKNKDDKYRLEIMEQIKHEYDDNPEATKAKYPEVFYYFDGLLNCVISQSQHPAGIVASPMNLIDYCGAFLGSDGQQILPLDMDQCHHLGLIKYDILGLKTIGVIDKTCKMIGKYFPSASEINFDDQAVYDDMNENPLTIFQFESPYAMDCFKKMGCRSIDDITLVNAALRPGGASYRDRLFQHEVNDNGSELINELLKDTYGYLAYQEQVTAFLQYVCGFSGSDADSIRRAIGKKDANKIADAMPQILEGYCNKSDKPRKIAEEEAKKFLKVIEDSSSYMFNKNHALGYSLLSYLCGYYRHYYPVEFCVAFLTCANNDDDIANGIQLAQILGVDVVGIQFKHSNWDYSSDSQAKKIYRGLSSIPYMSKAVVNSMVTEAYNHEYSDFTEVLMKLSSISSKMNTRQIEVLIKMNFFSDFGSISYLLQILQLYKKMKNRKKCFDLVKEETAKIPYDSKSSLQDIIQYEFAETGIVTTVIPKLGDNIYFITDIKGNLYTLHQLSTGRNLKIKIRVKTTKQYGSLSIGNIIKVLEIQQECKWYKDENNEWKQKTDSFEDVIKSYYRKS